MNTLDSKWSGRGPQDSDEPFVWPPGRDTQTTAAVLDLRKNAVVSLDEAAREFEADGRAVSADGSLRDEGMASSASQSPADMSAASSAPSRASVDDIGWLHPILSRTLVWGLALAVVTQAIAIVLLVARDRSRNGISDSSAAVAVTPPLAGEARPRAAEPAQLKSLAPASVPIAASLTANAGTREGTLLVRSEPAGATVVVDALLRGTAPLTLDGIAAGTHRLQILKDGASVEQMVTVAAGGTTDLLVPLNASGWVEVRAPVDVQIFEKGRLLGASADGPISLAIGRHRLDLRNEPLGYRGQAVGTVVAGQITRLHAIVPAGVLDVDAQPWALVLIDGEEVAATPLTNLRVPLGRREIRFRHPILGERVRQVVVSAGAPARVSVDLRQR
jgi:hypothetical protein